MAFAETGTFNINDGRNANKNYLLSSDSQSNGLCGVRNCANQPWMKTSTCRTAHTWKRLFLTSELENKAEITISSARDTTRTWVPGRGIMGRNVGIYKIGYNTWLSSRLQNQPRFFRFVLINFFFSLFSSFFFRYHAPSSVGSAVLISFL